MVANSRKTAETGAGKIPFVTSGPKGQYTWQELEVLEKRRRSVLKRVEKNFYSVLCHVDGTVVYFLGQDTLFWLTLILYVLIRVQARLGDVPAFVSNLESGSVALIGGWISFFLVLYVNKSHSRYFGLYEISMGCKGRIHDAATMAATYIPIDQARRLIRYMNAAHVAGYTGLSQTYPAATFFHKLNKDFGLLTRSELRRMEEIDMDKGGSCHRELIVWSLRVIEEAKLEDKLLEQDLRSQVLQLRGCLGKLTDALDLPIPFFYVHFICLLTALYLPLFALSTGYKAGTGSSVYWTSDVVAGLVVLLQAIFVNGLRILGQKMSDPYGDDLIDLSVIFYCTDTWTMSNRILESDCARLDLQEEAQIRLDRNPLGAPWNEAPPEVFDLHEEDGIGKP